MTAPGDQALGPVGLGIGGKGSEMTNVDGLPFERMDLGGYEVRCGFVPVEPPTLDPGGEHRDAVVVRVRTFSCNYRDRALTLRMANIPKERGFYLIGSELGGEVVVVGDGVTNLRAGDRVMVDGYFGTGPQPWGIPTNHTSRALQILPARKLIAVPPAMSDEEAAGFSIGAQTSYSMVRRAGVESGANVLVTAATSNTSLFLAQAARNAGGNVVCTTSSVEKAERIESFGFDRVFVIGRDTAAFGPDSELVEFTRDINGFDAVLDPYFDLHLNRTIPLLAPFGQYLSCGLERQFPEPAEVLTAMTPEPVLDHLVFGNALARNVSIALNCLGSTEDLEHAIDDYTNGALSVPIDSVIEAGPAVPFLRRTYCEPDRFGKVICRYG